MQDSKPKGVALCAVQTYNVVMTTSIDSRYKAGLEAIEQLKRTQLDPNAHNYAVWFAALSKEHPDLAKVIHDIQTQGVPLTQERMDFLFSAYVGNTQGAIVHETALAARRLFAEVLMAIQQFSGASGEVGSQMNASLSGLGAEPTVDELKNLASEIVRGASRLKESGDVVHKKLSESHKEIEGLREHLTKATEASEKDFLTNLDNRKAFERKLYESIEGTKRDHSSLVLLMIDVDHFKAFNDQFGHVIGDEVLKIVARALTDTVKGMDTVARYGGEEFAVILPNTPIGGGMIVGEAIRKAIASRELKRRDTGQNYGAITVSVGVASYHPEHDTLESFVQRADAALYRSKNAGRNRVTQEVLGG